MAKHTPQNISNGESRTLRQSRRHDEKSKKNSKTPMKSNITNKAKSHRAGGQSVEADEQGEDESGDSSAIGEHASTTEDPDVSALPGTTASELGEETPRLAGLKTEDDDVIFDAEMLVDMQGVDVDDNESEDGYADVENVSDSEVAEDEDDENDVLRSAERDLIDEFERTEQRRSANAVTLDLSDMAIDDDAALAGQLNVNMRNFADDLMLQIDMNDDPFLGLGQEDNLYHDMWNEAESAIWRMPETARTRDDGDSHLTQKRVRFEEMEVAASSSSDSEDPNDVFPDLFTPQDDARVKQHFALGLEQDLDLPNGFNDTESFYDFEDEDEKLAFEVDEESDSEYDSSAYDCMCRLWIATKM